jgi:hypothetical protein
VSKGNPDSPPFWQQAAMNRDNCIGAAVITSFIADLFTLSRKDSFSKTEVLIILDAVGRRELPEDMFEAVKDMADF